MMIDRLRPETVSLIRTLPLRVRIVARQIVRMTLERRFGLKPRLASSSPTETLELRARMRRLSPQERATVRQVVRLVLDDLLGQPGGQRQPARYPQPERSIVLGTGPVTVPYRVFKVVRNPVAPSSKAPGRGRLRVVK